MTSGARRVPGLEPNEWSDEVRALLMSTLGPVGGLEEGGRRPGAGDRRPLAVLPVIARQPRLLGPFLAWASALALSGVLPRRDHELLALRVAWNCGSAFEWGHHGVYARAAGLADREIARVADGPDAAGWSPDDAALLRAADELHRDATVTDDQWSRLAAHYDASGLVELTFVVGQYTVLSMVANATGVELEPGHAPLPPRS